MKYRLMPLWGSWALGSADYIVAVSSGVADDLSVQTGIRREKFRVIYNPVITDALYTAASEPVDHPWFQPGEPPVILAVGRLDKQKDFPMLVRAFHSLRSRRATRLMILGGHRPSRFRAESIPVHETLRGIRMLVSVGGVWCGIGGSSRPGCTCYLNKLYAWSRGNTL
jgi:glycosyltransferase involved in cell wall biosynthesis